MELALTVLDGAKFELIGEEVKVTEADFSKSKGAAGGDGGEENSDDAKKKADKYAHVPKEEIRKNAALLKRKAERQLGWDGFDDEHDPTKTMVVLRNIYDETDLEEAIKDGLNAQTFSDELKEDVAEECQAKCGKVEKMRTSTRAALLPFDSKSRKVPIRVCTSCIIDGSAGNKLKLNCGTESRSLLD